MVSRQQLRIWSVRGWRYRWGCLFMVSLSSLLLGAPASLAQPPLQTVPTAAQLYRLGIRASSHRHVRVAVDAWTQFLQRFPDHAERESAMIHLAALAFEQGGYDDALPLYERLVQLATPLRSLPWLYLRLGQCEFGRQRFEVAQQYYERIVHELPTHTETRAARYQLGVVALAQDRVETARGQFNRLIQDDPQSASAARAHRALAWIDYRQGQVEVAATALYQHGLLAVPTAADTVLAKAYEQVRLQHETEAIAILREALTTVVTTDFDVARRLHGVLLQAYRQTGQWALALQSTQAFIQRFPEGSHTADLQRWQAEFLMQRQETTKALSAYRKASSLSDTDAEAEAILLQIAAIESAQGMFAAAAETLEHWLHRFPLSLQRAAIQLRLGAVLTRQGALTRAVTLYHDLLEVEDTLPQPMQQRVRLQLAWTYLKGGQHESALELYNDLVRQRLDPQIDYQARFWQAWLLQHQQDDTAAAMAWRRLLLSPLTDTQHGEILWYLGRHHMARQQYAKASAYLHQVVTQHAAEPYARLATWQLQRCYLELQQYRRALDASPVFRRQDPLGGVRAPERFDQGEQAFKAQRYEAARQQFRQVGLYRTPLGDDAEFLIAESYAAEGQTDLAWQHYRRVTQRYSYSRYTALAFYRQGVLLQQTKQLAAAVVPLREASRLALSAQLRFQVNYRLGTIYMALRQPEAAKRVLLQLLQDAQSSAALESIAAAEQLHIGLMLQQVEAYESSLVVLQQVGQTAPTEALRAEAQFWVAETQQLQGDRQMALTSYHQVARQFPQQPAWAITALFRAGELYEQGEQYDQAMTMYQRVQQADPTSAKGRFAAEKIRTLQARIPAQGG